MKTLKERNIEAFFMAVSQLETPIDDELEQAIQKIKNEGASLFFRSNLKSFPKKKKWASIRVPFSSRTHRGWITKANQSPKLHKRYNSDNESFKSIEKAINLIDDTVEKYPALKELYEQAKWNLSQQSDIQELYESNITDSDTLDYDFYLSPTVLEYISQAKKNLLVFSVLKSLDENPLTIEDLSYKISMPKNEVKQIVDLLWQEGKIDTLTGGILGKIFPALRNKKQYDMKSCLTLTSIGHFYLYPISNIKKIVLVLWIELCGKMLSYLMNRRT